MQNQQLTKVWDLAWSVDGDTIELEQEAGIGEVHCMTLHRMHLRQLATEAGLLNGDPDAWRLVETLGRRLRTLADRIAILDDRLCAVPVVPSGSNCHDPDLAYSEATRMLAQEWCADLPTSVADELEATPSQATERHATPPAAAHGRAGSQPGLPGLDGGRQQ